VLDLRPYLGRWVALVAGRVVGSGRTLGEARQVGRRNQPGERLEVGLVVPGNGGRLQTELPLGDLMTTLRPLLAESESPIYLVGGAVRDALLGRASHDLDFAVGDNAIAVARSVADALNGAFYVLDAERGTARVILGDAVLDFARFRGDSLLADLRDRDFTINAIALPSESADPDAIIDPLSGQDDLAAQLIRATHPAAIRRDPLRGLRAVRLAAELGFHLLPETGDLIRAASDGLATVSAERIRDEFCRLLIAPAGNPVRLVDQLALLQHVLPELLLTKGVFQPAPHTLDVFEHGLQTLEQLDPLLRAIASPPSDSLLQDALALANDYLAPYASHLEKHLNRRTGGRRSGRVLLFLGALLHDVGKPASRTVDEDGRIRFLGHEQLGEEIVRQRAGKLALSAREVRQVAAMVRHHMRPALLSQTHPTARPSRRAIHRFFKDVGANGLDICLLSLADGLAKGARPEPAGWERRVQTVATLLDHFFHHYDRTVAPPPLLSGRELMSELGIHPGPEVGRLLRLIQEAQAAGEVTTVAGALTLAREACNSMENEPGIRPDR